MNEPKEMTYDEYIQKQTTGVCVPTRKSYELIKSFIKYENMLEESNEYSGCENSEYRKESFSDEFVNCKFCYFAQNSLRETPCTGCHGNFLRLPNSCKMIGPNFSLSKNGFASLKKQTNYFMHKDCLKLLCQKKEAI